MPTSAFSFYTISKFTCDICLRPQVRLSPAAMQIKKHPYPSRRERKGGRKALPYGSYDHRIASTVPLMFSS